MSDGEGNLAPHSGGSCQASLSFDNGKTWKVLHTWHGGCPRGVKYQSERAGPNQLFFFHVPAETRAGQALFSWSWFPVTPNKSEMFQSKLIRSTSCGCARRDDPHDSIQIVHQ